MYKNYAVQFADHPSIYVLYSTDDIDYEKFLFFYNPTDTERESVQVDSEIIADKKFTKNILKQYSQMTTSASVFEKGEDGKIVHEEYFPDKAIFRVEKLKNEHAPFKVFLASDDFEIRTLAEMCKPVVYYYGDENQKNTLTLNPKNGDFFTKLIPEFTSENTWKFTSKKGKISVENKNYDYLYYSLATVDYQHNEHGWIVRGEDAVKFFEDKLVKIGFNPVEKTDFIDYWKDKYQSGKYYFISFKYTDELEKIITLDFANKPAQMFRVLLDSYELARLSPHHKKFLYQLNISDTLDRKLIKTFDRDASKSAVFEWGGVLQTREKRFVK